jgi:HK97 family phage portal protein
VAIHNAATQWNKALLDNAARPSGALVYDSGKDGATLSAEQFARLKAEMEAAFQGAVNAGRPMLLEGGLRWQSLSMSPAEMDFVALKAAAAREIALAFGVPPMLLGIPGDNTYANYREANKALWRQTIVPLMSKILGGIAQGLRGWMPGLELGVDMDKVPELADERSAYWERIAGAGFLSDEEKRALLGFGVI